MNFVFLKNIFSTQNKIIALLLFFILIKGIIWAWNIPLFTLSDEVTHFTYIHYLSEHKELPRKTDTMIKLEKSTVELRKVLKMIKIDKTPLSNAHLNFSNATKDRNGSNPISFNDFLNNSNLRAGWSFNYPPFYYAYASIFYTIGKNLNFDIIAIAYLIRFSAVIFLIITVVFSYKIAFIFSRDSLFAIIICSIISLMVSVSAVFSSINNDVALIAFGHIVLYLTTRIFYSTRQKIGRLTIFWFLAFIPAIYSKPQAIIFIPLLIGALIYNGLKNKGLRINAAINILFIAAAALIAILLLPIGFLDFFKINLASINGMNEITTIVKNDFLRRINLVFDFFVQLGLFHSGHPIWIFSFLGTLIFLSLVGIILFFFNFFKNKNNHLEKARALLLNAAPIIILEILYTFLYYREAIINKVYDFPGQGRYYFIVLAPLVIIFVYGLQYVSDYLKLPRRILYFILILFFALLNSYFFANIILSAAYL